MTKVNIYTVKGTKKSKGMSLPEKFQEKENLNLLAQAVRVYENRAHAGRARTKTRGEVVASTRKIYAQKGTGRARHGALSASIFVGGSKAHGPDGRKKILSLPKKMARKALSVAISLKAKENNFMVVDEISSLKSTKEAAKLVDKLTKSTKKDKNRNILVVLSDTNKKASLYLRNIDGVTVDLFSSINAYKVFNSTILIVDKDALKDTEKKESKKNKK